LGIVGVLALSFGGWFVGERVGSGAIVYAPNAGRPAPAESAGEFRVPVGPPNASIAYEIAGCAQPKATIVVLHGIRDSRLAMRGWGTILGDAGYRVVLVDLRGQSRSTGDFLTYGVVESRDLVQVLDELDTAQKRVGKVGVLGVSYGAATAIQWAGIDSRIDAVVAVAPFSSLPAVVPGYLPVPLPKILVRQTLRRAGKLANFDPWEADTVAGIRATHARVLLMHGRNDDRISFHQSEALHEAAPQASDLVIVDGETHDSLVGDERGFVKGRAGVWFDRWLR
jgi:pimeloyl-ACP methyl ester carboxylesterase